jgi:hypothetical protein
MRNHDALHIVVHDPTVAIEELRSFWADLPNYGEVWVERLDGTRVCTRNPRYSGSPGATLDFVLSNGERDSFPAAWTYPTGDVLRALERFATDGLFPRDFEWHNDSGDGSSPPTECET